MTLINGEVVYEAAATVNKPIPFVGAVVGALIAAAAVAQSGSAPALEADVIFQHGEVYTPSGWAQAIAVKNGVIVAIGPDAAVAASKGAKTRVIDLKGAAVLPGLHDTHVHPGGAGAAAYPMHVSRRDRRPQVVLDAIKGCVRAARKRASGSPVASGMPRRSGRHRRIARCSTRSRRTIRSH